MYFQCVLILALSLVQNEAAKRLGFVQNPGLDRALRSGSSKLIQGSFDTAAELAKLIQRVKKAGDEKVIEDTSTPEEETNLQAIFNVIQKKMNNEGIRIHVLKNPGVLDEYKDNLGSRAVFIDNPEVLDKYVEEVKKQKTNGSQQTADLEKLLLKRRNAVVFRMEEPTGRGSKNLRPKNLQDSKQIRKRSEGGKSEEISKQFNKGLKDRGWEMSSGNKQRDMMDRNREIKKDAREKRGYNNERENRGFKNEQENRGFKNEQENRGFKNEQENRGFKKEQENRGFKNEQENRGFKKELENRGSKNDREDRGFKNDREDRGFKKEQENRGFKNDREDRGFKDVRERPIKREFKDYPDFKSQGNPNLARPKAPARSKIPDYDYDKPKKPKAILRDYDEGFENKKRNKDKFDDYGGDKNKGDQSGRGQSMGSEPRKKPAAMNWDDKPKRNFNNDNERRRPKKEEGWAPSIGERGSNDYNQRSSKNNDGYGFGNTPIPFNRPRNIYVNDRGE